MIRIFIATNFGQLDNVLPTQIGEKGIHLIEHNQVIYWTDGEDTFSPNAQETAIFVMKDLIRDFPNQVEEEDYLLYHEVTQNQNAALLEKFASGKKVKGHNTTERKDLYRPAFNIILDSEPKKAERIYEAIFKKDLHLRKLLEPFRSLEPTSKLEETKEADKILLDQKASLNNYVKERYLTPKAN